MWDQFLAYLVTLQALYVGERTFPWRPPSLLPTPRESQPPWKNQRHSVGDNQDSTITGLHHGTTRKRTLGDKFLLHRQHPVEAIRCLLHGWFPVKFWWGLLSTEKGAQGTTRTTQSPGSTRKRTLGDKFLLHRQHPMEAIRCLLHGWLPVSFGGSSEPGSTLGCQRTIHGFGSVTTTRDKNRTGQRQDKVTQCHDPSEILLELL